MKDMMVNHNDTNKDNFVEGNEALTNLQSLLNDQHGKAVFNDSLRVARLERNLIDSMILARKHKKLTQKDLAKNLNTKAQQISKYERAEQVPTLSVLLKLCEVLNLELSLKSKEDETVVFHS